MLALGHLFTEYIHTQNTYKHKKGPFKGIYIKRNIEKSILLSVFVLKLRNYTTFVGIKKKIFGRLDTHV